MPGAAVYYSRVDKIRIAPFDTDDSVLKVCFLFVQSVYIYLHPRVKDSNNLSRVKSSFQNSVSSPVAPFVLQNNLIRLRHGTGFFVPY